MRLGLRLLFAFFVITGLAGFFALQVFQSEVKPSAREVMEDVLVDTANLLAEQATADLRAMPAGGTLQDSRLAQQVAAYRRRPVDIRILDWKDVYLSRQNGEDEVFPVQAVRAQAAKRVAMRFRPERVTSWDHRKLGGLY